MLKVSYQGIEGAYSHLACYNYLEEIFKPLEQRPLKRLWSL